jgi:hypothetical protein
MINPIKWLVNLVHIHDFVNVGFYNDGIEDGEILVCTGCGRTHLVPRERVYDDE